MFLQDLLVHRMRRGIETTRWPDGAAPALPARHGGALRVQADRCPDGCRACVDVCPTEAVIRPDGGTVRLDMGRCLFCAECVAACPSQAITHTGDHRMAVRSLQDLVVGPEGVEVLTLAGALDAKLLTLFGRSLRLRQVSAGGCNACEADVNVLGTIGWDIGRFGIQMVASPRHADGLLITGPVTRNMEAALRATWEAVPEPKIVIAVGACALSGGPFVGLPDHLGGAAGVVPVDLFIPGCPPHPLTVLDGLLRLLDGLAERSGMPA